KQPAEFISCYEAGYDGFWLHRLLEENGVRNYVIDPASLQVDRRARRVKTDNVDVTKLLRSLMAYLRGEPKVWRVVRVPTVAEEDDRRLHRERDRLINERVHALSTAPTTTSHLGWTERNAWSNCGRVMNANSPRVSKLRSGGNCSG